MYNYLMSGVQTKAAIPDVNIHILAALWFVLITAAGYLLYLTKKEKG
jgi:hypothetical protein